MSNSVEEIIINGVPASPGTVMGKAYLQNNAAPAVESERIEEVHISDHLNQFENACESLRGEWTKLHEQVQNDETKTIIAAQMEIIADPELAAQVKAYIKNDRFGARRSIKLAFAGYMELLAESGSKRMEGRMVDLADIRDRLMEAADPQKKEDASETGDILVAREITPREVIQLSHQQVKGFVMEQGGHTSHAAIIARSMGIPAVVGAKGTTRHINETTMVCLNGEQGLVIINPTSDGCEQARVLNEGKTDSLEEKIAICSRPSRTKDDRPFIIRANVEFPEELRHAEQFGAQGVGLLRTESIYLEQQAFGSAENQIPLYEEIAEKTGDHPLTIRLFDVGGDKFRESDVKENNPFLGWRGIRMLLDKRELLREQLKAILTVAHNHPGRIKILLPMVSTIEEVNEVKKEIENCRQHLYGQEDAGQAVPVGMMVEIPSAAIHADQFAEHVDFFSIGTNDLTQYLLAVDRGNAFISGLYDQQHPAIWKVIDHVVRAAAKRNIEVEVCGELASYPVAAACLLGMGVGTLSMSPVSIPPVKKVLLRNSFAAMEALAEQVLLCENPEEVKSLFADWASSRHHD
jgi:phosphotransferase system enzyme I (PtsI)